MNFKQLTAFREIMLCGSISQAARNLNRTQPAISASLKALENDLQMELFNRESGRLLAIPEAHYLLSEATELIEKVATVRQNLLSLQRQESGILRIASMPGPSAFLLPELISQFVAAREDVKVTLVTRSSPQVYQLIASQNFDLGIAEMAVMQDTNANLLNETSFDSACVCAIPQTHALTEMGGITAADLDDRPMAILTHTHTTHQMTSAAFKSAGAKLNIRFETQYFLPLLRFVEAGQACAIVTKLSAQSYNLYKNGRSKIVFRPFVPEINYRHTLLTPSHHPPSLLAKSFCDLWLKTVSEAHKLEFSDKL